MIFIVLILAAFAAGFAIQYIVDRRDLKRRVERQMAELDELLEEYRRKVEAR